MNHDDSSATSISEWIVGVKQRDERAAQQIWNRYYEKLVQLAKTKLQGVRFPTEDAEDVAAMAINEFYRGAQESRYPNVRDRKSLWPLLLKITADRAIDEYRKTRTQKKEWETRLVSIDNGPDSQIRNLAVVISNSPTPEFTAMVREQLVRFIGMLDPRSQKIVIARMAGYTRKEIAEHIKMTIATVDLELAVARKKLQRFER